MNRQEIIDEVVIEISKEKNIPEHEVGTYDVTLRLADRLVNLLTIPVVSNCADLKHELEVTDKLLNERQRVLDAIPECESHGKCVPHAIEWIEEMKSKHCC